MNKVLVTESNLQDIADAIRSKNEGTDTYRPGDMAAAILAIPTGGTLVSKTITQNGSYDAEDDNADGYSDVTVNVPNSYSAEDEGKVVSSGALVAQTGLSVTENGTYDTTLHDEVAVNVSGGSAVVQPLSVTENGTYNPLSGVDGYAPVTVNVSGGSTPIKLYPDADPTYYSETENQLLIELKFGSSRRQYYKYSSDPAYVAYFSNGTNSGPILVSETDDGAKYTAAGTTTIPAGTITYRGKTYYYSAANNFMRGNNKLNGFATYLGVFSNSELAAEALLDVALPSAFVITENGTYTVPSGYDGFRDIVVNVTSQ